MTLVFQTWQCRMLLLALAWAALIFVCVYPGGISTDTITLMHQGRTGAISDSFPPILAVLWGGVQALTDDPALMLALQLALFFGGIGAVAAAYAPRLHRLFPPAVVVVMAMPPVLGIVGALWSDVLMAAALLGAVGLVALSGTMRRAIAIGAWGCAALLVFVAVGARHNALAAVAPLLVWAFATASLRRTGEPALIRSTLVAALATIGLFIASQAFSAAVVEKKTHFWTVLAKYDVIGTALRSGTTEPLEMFLPATEEDIRALYTPRSVIPLMTGVQIHSAEAASTQRARVPWLIEPEQRRAVASAWLEGVRGAPAAYLSHRSAVFGSLLGLGGWPLWDPVWTRIDPGPAAHVARVQPRPETRLGTGLAQILHSGFFAPWIFLALACVLAPAALVAALRTRDEVPLLAAALLASGLCHMAGLFFIAMSGDYRYSHWMITTTLLAAVLLLGWGGARMWGAAAVSRPAPVLASAIAEARPWSAWLGAIATASGAFACLVLAVVWFGERPVVLVGLLVALAAAGWVAISSGEWRKPPALLVASLVAALLASWFPAPPVPSLASLAPAAGAGSVAITAGGDRRAGGHGSEVWLVDARTASGVEIPLDAFAPEGAWERRPGAWVFVGGAPARLTMQAPAAERVILTFVSHPWSGMVTISSDFGEETVDLYAVGDSRRSVALLDERARWLLTIESALSALSLFFAALVAYAAAIPAARLATASAPPGRQRTLVDEA